MEAKFPEPTRRDIERLFDDLVSYREPDYGGYAVLKAQLEELKERLLNVPAYTKLQKRVDEAYKRNQAASRQMRDRVREVRQHYYVNGFTKEVQAMVRKLVKDYNNTK